MMNAVPRVCASCGTSLSIRDRRCPNPACGADEPLDMPAEEIGTTRIMHAEESATPYKTIAVGVGALLLVVALGYGLFRFSVSYFDGGRPDPTVLPKPTAAAAGPAPGATAPGSVPGAVPGVEVAPSSAEASPSPAAGPRVRVVNTENQGVRFRQRPSTEGQVLRSLPEGTVLEVVGPDAEADGLAWRNVREPGGAVGWVAAEFVAPE